MLEQHIRAICISTKGGTSKLSLKTASQKVEKQGKSSAKNTTAKHALNKACNERYIAKTLALGIICLKFTKIHSRTNQLYCSFLDKQRY